ncbi:hypothetical protein [Polymorphospora lycopeni]|uniref:Uncharacterized protein n=1 Tax=Polymorphospora lycopeni TaxID=3140240 RepID=A0ABV5D0Y0_9ACTN
MTAHTTDGLEATGMLGERIAAAVQRHVARRDETVVRHIEHPELVTVQTTGWTYYARRADWSVAAHPGVEAVFRVVVDRMMDNFVITYGLLVPPGEEALLLNDVAVLRDLQRRLGGPVDPLAYAELLAELGSTADITGPRLTPMAATTAYRAGWLIRDVDGFRRRYPEVDPGLVAPPVVRPDPPSVEFHSHNYVIHHAVSGIDIYRWTVRLPADAPAHWDRQVVESDLAVRPWLHERPDPEPAG